MPDFRQRFGALVATERHPIRAEAPPVQGDKTTAVLRLYDPIDSYGDTWGISAKEFASVVDELPDSTQEIRLLINSPGGEVTEGLAILNILRSHPANVTAVVEGIAASAASFIAAGCDSLVMAQNAEMFIHDAWGLCVGNADDMRSLADDLDHLSDNIASIYAAKTGGTVDDWRQTMSDGAWFGAQDAVDAGLADFIDEQSDPAAADKAKNRFDLSVFKNSGRNAPGPVSATPPSPSPPKGQKGGSMPELTPEHLDLLGLTEDASAEDIQARLTELAATPEPPDPPTLPEGVVAVDASQLEQLRADAAAGRDARAQQLADQRAQLVNAAVNDGRIPPARREHWLAQLAADPGAEQTLASLEPGLIPVSAKGSGGSVDIDADEANYRALFGEEVKA